MHVFVCELVHIFVGVHVDGCLLVAALLLVDACLGGACGGACIAACMLVRACWCACVGVCLC